MVTATRVVPLASATPVISAENFMYQRPLCGLQACVSDTTSVPPASRVLADARPSGQGSHREVRGLCSNRLSIHRECLSRCVVVYRTRQILLIRSIITSVQSGFLAMPLVCYQSQDRFIAQRRARGDKGFDVRRQRASEMRYIDGLPPKVYYVATPLGDS